MRRLCAPLTSGPDWPRALEAARSLGIAAVELAPGWETAADVAALATALRRAGMTVAMAPLAAGPLTTEGLSRQLAAYAPLAVDSLLLPTQPSAVEGAQLAALANLAESAGVTLLLQNHPGGWPADGLVLGQFVAAVGRAGLRACYDPALTVGLKRHPFLAELMPGPLKRYTHCLRLRDAAFSDGAEVPPNEGNAELKELVSALECRNYTGWYALSPCGVGTYECRLTVAYAAVRTLLDSL
ncbi:MAG: TIM barrel protein [Anaerolineae bacterium]